jgi:hypothetical protein
VCAFLSLSFFSVIQLGFTMRRKLFLSFAASVSCFICICVLTFMYYMKHGFVVKDTRESRIILKLIICLFHIYLHIRRTN